LPWRRYEGSDRDRIFLLAVQADTVAWLLEGARMLTGEVLFVDGGLHATPPR
jgi:hypothetical protein